ncbi:hypothetical protein [Acetobacter sp.]|jgi:hypothetical protein|uniref:hypothetical protein n=1 Tax=Acetobacter sp. TaxID=440 RepID=UPI0025C06CF6|nr:hypothetical protein [Acetobacter sp.]MCH4089921.1 hypothetical protein [Acetobacter sp.]MCI1298617.1 hypothetical protein [Acetobacter sp.]MCI1315182.1 hypothetical protein [Acetobacter sp.]
MENPLEDSPQRDARIKARANEMWVADGKPTCGPEGYLEAATDLVGMELNPDAGEIPVEFPVPLAPNGQPIENAKIQENLGNPGGSMDELDDRQEVPFGTRAEEGKALKDS